MNYERQKRLVERLLDQTRNGNLSWQEGAGSHVFQVSFPNNSVQIAFVGNRGGADVSVSIIDSSGRTTEIFDDEDFSRDGERNIRTWNEIMMELYQSARRNALKADEVLDSILAEIG